MVKENYITIDDRMVAVADVTQNRYGGTLASCNFLIYFELHVMHGSFLCVARYITSDCNLPLGTQHFLGETNKYLLANIKRFERMQYVSVGHQ